MANSFTYVPYNETGYFSKLVTDYLSRGAEIRPFYAFDPTPEGIASAIEQRKLYKVNRKALVETLRHQYSELPQYGNVAENIQLLLNENTFTVCTAHQPNLLTGYLYFIYKILHAIKLAEQLNTQYPDKHFVPVYYMGSEDNDIEELGTFKFNGERYVWDGDGQTGAVGRMQTKGLKKLLNELFKVFGPPGKNCDELVAMLTTAYLQHDTVAKATQYLVNELFGRFGLLVLNPDEALLKADFIPVMEDELLNQRSFGIVGATIKKLEPHYKIQAHPREINLFYLKDDIRERIERRDEKWVVLNTAISWTKDELLSELREHPERFSPNVMLRGLYQETILPNIAFIGGGAEVAYWMQLKTLFEDYKVFYPVVLLRQSVLWIEPKEAKLRQELGLSIGNLFRHEAELVREYVTQHSGSKWSTKEEAAAIERILEQLRQKATSLDPTLDKAAASVTTRMEYQLKSLENKMLRAEKRKMEVQISRINRLRAALFPGNSLQERVENFTEYYLRYGPACFDTIKEGIKPLGTDFLVIEEKPA